MRFVQDSLHTCFGEMALFWKLFKFSFEEILFGIFFSGGWKSEKQQEQTGTRKRFHYSHLCIQVCTGRIWKKICVSVVILCKGLIWVIYTYAIWYSTKRIKAISGAYSEKPEANVSKPIALLTALLCLLRIWSVFLLFAYPLTGEHTTLTGRGLLSFFRVQTFKLCAD